MLTLDGTNKIVAENLSTEVTTLLTPKNWIINGGFDVWQRGTSQTSSGYGSDDRWNNSHDISTKTSSRQAFTVGQTNVPNNPTYFSRTVVTSGGTSTSYVIKLQPIEDVAKLAGKTVSLSFWAKADASKNVAIEFRQSFGTGGSTSVSGIGVQKFTLTTAWQRFTKTVSIPSVSGKTIGTNNSLQIQFWLDAGSAFNANTDSLGNQSGTFDIANVSLVEGSVPVEWQTEAYADVLRQCQRYLEPTRMSMFARDSSGATILERWNVQKRTSPSLTLLNGGALYLLGATTIYPSGFGFGDISVNGVGYCYANGGSWTAGQVYYFDVMVSSEL